MRRIPLGVLQEREFRLFFTGQMVSLLGDAVTPFALAWAVLDLTGSARDLGFVIAAKTAPLVFFLLVGGVFADRLPRRGVMLTADVARMATQAATAALLVSHTARARAEAALGDPRRYGACHRLREHALQHALGDDAAAAHPAGVALARQCL